MADTHRADLDSTSGDPVLAELVNRVTDRLLAGEDADPSELAAAAPEHAARVRSLLPALQALADLSAERRTSGDIETPPAGNGSSADVTPWPPADFSNTDGYFARQLHGFLDAPQRTDEIGRLADYRVLSVLGAGGAGIVLRAEDEALQREVAIKVMAPPLAALGTTRARFRREAQAMAAIEHEHVVSVHRVGEHRGLPFLVMPLLVGETLRARLARQGALPTQEVLRIGREIALALAAAHARGLLHRDIKPDNIWLCAPGDKVRVLDFGLAHSAQDDELTLTGTVLGTPRYMSPEQARGQTVDARSDLFSLGTVLYQAAAGQCPFEAKSCHGVVQEICEHTPPSLTQRTPGVPAGVGRLVERLLEKSPELRPASAEEVVAEIRAMEDDGNGIPQLRLTRDEARGQRMRRMSGASQPRGARILNRLAGSSRGSRWRWACGALAVILAIALPAHLLRVKNAWHSRELAPQGEPANGVKFLFAFNGGPWPLNAPMGLVAEKGGGRLIVADYNNRAVRVFDGRGNAINFLGGLIDGKMCQPGAVTLASSGEMWVCDRLNLRLLLFKSDGTFARSFYGQAGDRPGQVNDLGAVAISPNGRLVYVTDVGNNRIQVCDTDGKFQFAFGEMGLGKGQLNFPIGIATDDLGDVYVSEHHNNRVQVFTADGTFKRKFGTPGRGVGELDHPQRLAVDAARRVYVADTHNNRVQVFDAEGNAILLIDGAESPDGSFDRPMGLTVDDQGRLYVADTRHNRVVVFRLPWTAAEGAAQVALADALKPGPGDGGRRWQLVEGKVTLRTHSGHYWQAQDGGGNDRYITTDSKTVGEYGVFYAKELSPGQWAFRSSDGYHWLNAENGGGKSRLVRPCADRPQEHETFLCETHGDRVAFRTSNRFYLSVRHGAENGHRLSADAESVGEEEKFYCERQ